MNTLSEIRVAVFASATGNHPKERRLVEVLDDIRGVKHAAEIVALRNLLARDRKQYDARKKALPAFTVSGTAKSRTEPLQHSGLLQVDLDKLGDRLTGLRDRVKSDPHVAFGFISPSGLGLKLGVAIDPARHGEHAGERMLAADTAASAIALADWFAGEQLRILARGRHVARRAKRDEALELLADTPKGIRASDVYRARIVGNADEAHELLATMETEGELTGKDSKPESGGHITRIFTKARK